VSICPVCGADLPEHVCWQGAKAIGQQFLGDELLAATNAWICATTCGSISSFTARSTRIAAPDS